MVVNGVSLAAILRRVLLFTSHMLTLILKSSINSIVIVAICYTRSVARDAIQISLVAMATTLGVLYAFGRDCSIINFVS